MQIGLSTQLVYFPLIFHIPSRSQLLYISIRIKIRSKEEIQLYWYLIWFSSNRRYSWWNIDVIFLLLNLNEIYSSCKNLHHYCQLTAKSMTYVIQVVFLRIMSWVHSYVVANNKNSSSSSYFFEFYLIIEVSYIRN